MELHDDINDCWNRIGVRFGNKCEQLREYMHCRNCPAYSDAARNLMHRPIPAEYRQTWARHYALAADDSSPANESAVVFRIGHEWLALPTQIVVTVAAAAAAHRLPHRVKPGLLGVVNVSGKLHPCIGLSDLMAIDVLQPYVQTGRHVCPRLIVAQLGRQTVALPVHDVHGIEHYRDADVLAPPSTVSKGVTRYLAGVLGIANLQVGCLDTELLGRSIAEVIR